MKKIIFILSFAVIAPLIALAQSDVQQPTSQQPPMPPIMVPGEPGGNPPPPPQGQPRQPSPKPDARPNGDRMPPQWNGESNEGEEDQRDFVDPRELQQIRRQLVDQKREAGRILKSAKKLGAAGQSFVDQLNALLAKIAEFATAFNSPNVTRDMLQDFFDSQPWEELNKLRAQIEIPKEIAKIEKDLKRLLPIAAKPSIQLDGLNLERVQTAVSEIQSAIAQAKSALASGDFEEIHDHLQVIYDGQHPGEIMGVLMRLREISRMLKGVRTADIRAEILAVLAPIIDAVNGGDFREANFMLNDLMKEFGRMMQYVRSAPKANDEFLKRLKGLEERLQQSEQNFERQQQQVAPGPQGYQYQPYRPGTMMGNLYYGMLDLLGL